MDKKNNIKVDTIDHERVFLGEPVRLTRQCTAEELNEIVNEVKKHLENNFRWDCYENVKEVIYAVIESDKAGNIISATVYYQGYISNKKQSTEESNKKILFISHE